MSTFVRPGFLVPSTVSKRQADAAIAAAIIAALSGIDTDDIPEGSVNKYFTDERAQDAVGTILTDTATVDLAYDDGLNTISANVLTIPVVDAAADTTTFVALFGAATGNQTPLTDPGLTYNASTNALTATTVIAALTGNASTATALATPRTIGGVSFDGTANIVPNTIAVIDAASDTTTFPMLAGNATGSLQPLTDSALTYNALTNVLAATDFNGTIGATTARSGAFTTLSTTGQALFNSNSSITLNAETFGIQYKGTSNQTATFLHGRWSADSSPPAYKFLKSRNPSIGSFTIVNDGDNLGSLIWLVDDGVDYFAEAAKIDATIKGTPGSNSIPGALRFHTTPSGSSVTSQAGTITPNQKWLLGTAANSTEITAASGVIPKLQINGAAITDASYLASTFGNNTNSPGFFFVKSRNTTVGSSTIVNSGDTLGSIIWNGDDGTDFQTPAASILAAVDGTPGANDMPGRLVFNTTADGASAVTEAARITSTHNLLIGHTADLALNATGRVQVVGNSTNASALCLIRYTNDQLGPSEQQGKSRSGTLGTNTIVQSGDVTANWNGYGANGSTFDFAAQIRFEIDTTPGASGDMPGRIIGSTTRDGAAAVTEAFRFDSKQNLGLRGSSFGGGDGVIFIANATTVPSSNPSAGGILYTEGGALKYRGSSGSITTVAAA